MKTPNWIECMTNLRYFQDNFEELPNNNSDEFFACKEIIALCRDIIDKEDYKICCIKYAQKKGAEVNGDTRKLGANNERFARFI